MENSQIYDYFVAEELNQKFVNIYPENTYRKLNDYFDYLKMINLTKEVFLNPKSLFAEEGWIEDAKQMNKENGNERYFLSYSYLGDDTYKASTYSIELTLNSDNSIDSLTILNRSFQGDISTDFERETDSLTVTTISDFTFSEKTVYDGNKFTLDMIPAESIHGTPYQKVDLSDVEDGELSAELAQKLINKIEAYSLNTKETNYSILYHDAFDFADTNRTTFGDALFTGKLIAYQDDILDNHGTIQLVDSYDLPKGEKYDFRIYTEAQELGVERGGEFSNYITDAYASIVKEAIYDLRSYTDANPLFYNEFQEVLSPFEQYTLGTHNSSNGFIELSANGEKDGNTITLEGRVRYSSKYGSDTTDIINLIINNGETTYFKLTTTGQYQTEKYTDVYEAMFINGEKEKFAGEKMDFNEILTQVTMEDFEVI